MMEKVGFATVGALIGGALVWLLVSVHQVAEVARGQGMLEVQSYFCPQIFNAVQQARAQKAEQLQKAEQIKNVPQNKPTVKK